MNLNIMEPEDPSHKDGHQAGLKHSNTIPSSYPSKNTHYYDRDNDPEDDTPSENQTPFTAVTPNWAGIRTLIGGVSLMLYLGCFFLWGNIDIYVLSYFEHYTPGADYSFIFLVDSFLMLANWIGYQVGTYLF